MSEEYNGWKNYETWNVALWIQNDESLYNMALECDSYQDFVESLRSEIEVLQDVTGRWQSPFATPDGVAWDASNLSMWELNDMIEEL